MFDSLCTTAVLGSVVFVVWFYSRRHSQLPPGPRLWLPFLGNMLSLGPDIKQTFRKWRTDYGDIFSLYIGSRLVVGINSVDVIKDAFVNHGDLFVSRPDVFVSQYTSKGRGISATSGQVWESQRRVALCSLQGFGMKTGRNILEIRINEGVKHLLKTIDEHKGRKVDLKYIVQKSTTNVLCSIVLGKRFEDDDPIFVEYLKRCRETFDAAAILNFIPYLQYFPCDIFNLKRIEENVKFTEEEVIKPEIRRLQKDFDVNNVTDFVSAYLKEIEINKDNIGSPVDDDNLVKSVRDLLNAGSETAATTIQWCLLYLITNPGVQEKCYQEIKNKVGISRLPCMSDKENLPYVEATIAEVQRCANINPLGVWRSTSRDITFRGYNIPKGTMIFPVLDSVLMDAEVWTNPDAFKPERFIDEEGHFMCREEWIPFSVGRRSCLGESFARMELFLFVTGLIQQYQFVAPKGTPLSLEPVPGYIYSPRCYRVQAFRRNNSRDLSNTCTVKRE